MSQDLLSLFVSCFSMSHLMHLQFFRSLSVIKSARHCRLCRNSTPRSRRFADLLTFSATRPAKVLTIAQANAHIKAVTFEYLRFFVHWRINQLNFSATPNTGHNKNNNVRASEFLNIRNRKTMNPPASYFQANWSAGSIHRPPSPPKRRVAFASTIRIRSVPHLDDYTDDDLERLYHTDSDLKKVQRELKEEIMRMRKFQDSKDGCYRGLESFCSDQHMSNLKEERNRLVANVFKAQEEAYKKYGSAAYISDDTAELEIALVSMKHSASAREAAYLLGKCDEAFVRKTVTKSRSSRSISAHKKEVGLHAKTKHQKQRVTKARSA